MKNRIRLGALLLSGVLVLAACSNGTNKPVETNKETVLETNKETSVETNKETSVEKETSNQNQSSKVDLNKAVDVFYNTFADKNITITKIEYEKDNGRYTYEIKGWKDNTEYKLEVDEETGDILEQKSETDNNIDKNDFAIKLDEIVDPDTAIKAAKEQVKDKHIEGWQLHTEEGHLVYEVDIDDGDDVLINALDGTFYKFD